MEKFNLINYTLTKFEQIYILCTHILLVFCLDKPSKGKACRGEHLQTKLTKMWTLRQQIRKNLLELNGNVGAFPLVVLYALEKLELISFSNLLYRYYWPIHL